MRLIILLFVAVSFLTSCMSTSEINKSIYPNSISKMEKIILGGEEQYILIRGYDIKNPVILMIHGGPGNSEMPLMRIASEGLLDKYTVVIWDQRGSGKSYSLLKDRKSVTRINIENDCKELIGILVERFNSKKIYLIGHSWGTVVCMNIINDVSDKVYAFIGIGQMVNFKEEERISYEFTLSQAINSNTKEDINVLKQIGQPINGLYKSRVDSLYVQRKLLLKYGGSLYNKTDYSEGYKIALFSPEYTIFDLLNYDLGSRLSLENIWNEDLASINYIETNFRINVPVFFFQGKHDFQTPFSLVEEYYNKLIAPQKELVWFENSCHSPLYEEIDKFTNSVIKLFNIHLTIASSG